MKPVRGQDPPILRPGKIIRVFSAELQCFIYKHEIMGSVRSGMRRRLCLKLSR
jgi:hypothetical protein